METQAGAVRLTDFMPIRKGSSVLVRVVTGLRGKTKLRTRLNLRFDYGSTPPWIERDGDAVPARVGPDLVVLRAPVPLDGDHHRDLGRVRRGRRRGAGLRARLWGFTPAPRLRSMQSGAVQHAKLLARVDRAFDKPTDWPEAVRRSLITLKAMIHRPTGGLIAAPTTSLPEAPGGEMNWDYRYCWLRDATFTLSALLNAGYGEEAAQWRDWLLRAVAGDPDKMRIMYRVDGARHLNEWIVPWLPGYRWASPVRIGNAASSQRQLDIYGELLDTLQLAAKGGMERSDQALRLEEVVVRHVEAVWQHPGQGMWESREKPRHYVYSKVMAWVAVDRFLRNRPAAKDVDRAMRSRLTDLRRRIHEEICADGFDAGLGTFVDYYGGQELDASLLLLPIVGFLPVEDERIAGTIAAIERDLVEDGLVRRWTARGANPEGAFLACTCWLADCQALQGRPEAARKTFERLLSVRNDLGLLAEEYNVKACHLSGNFPQALSHLALVQTALALCGPVTQRGAETICG